MDLGLRGSGALVTGGGRGIGKAAAASLAREGAAVVLLGRDRPALERAALEVGAVGVVVADTTDDGAVCAAVEQTLKLVGRLDVVVNCAAPRASSAHASTGMNDLDDAWLLLNVDTKVLGYLRVARAAAPHLRQSGGAIVNVSGTNARRTGYVVGSIRNSGVVALSKNLADELGPSGIAVTCVHPGPIGAGLESEACSPGMSDNLLRRSVTAGEVADVIAFLSSRLGRVTTGSVISADGGHPGVIWA